MNKTAILVIVAVVAAAAVGAVIYFTGSAKKKGKTKASPNTEPSYLASHPPTTYGTDTKPINLENGRLNAEDALATPDQLLRKEQTSNAISGPGVLAL